MKIGIPSSLPSMDGAVVQKLGSASYLLIVETDDMSFTVSDGPKQSSGPGAGIAVITLAVNMGAQVILAGYVAQHIADALKKQSIEVISGCSGTVGEAVAEYMKTRSSDGFSEKTDQSSQAVSINWGEAVRK